MEVKQKSVKQKSVKRIKNKNKIKIIENKIEYDLNIMM